MEVNFVKFVLLLVVVTIQGFVTEKRSNVPATCDGQPDGTYPIADVFKYMECASGTASFKQCPKTSIYEPGQKHCVPVSTQSQERFCENRTIGDWQDPWNCHGLFKCVHGVSHFVPCQLPNLVFDPYLDQCVYPSKYACHQVPQNYIVTADNPCESKGDGSYAIPDVFGYLQCKDHVAKYGSCPETDVFDEKQGKCVDSSSLSKKTFCDDRNTGNYRDPWDCHSFITCVHGTFIERQCAEKDLVYDPYHDLCEHESKFKCKELKNQNDLVVAENPCESKGDGSYAIPDVFGYLQCKSHIAKYVTCPDTDVFDEKQGKCVDSSSLSKKTFCDDRNTGNYRDPWDCHSFITCVHGTFIERQCAEKDLVYDPYDDRCGYEIKFKCKELKKQTDLVTAENPFESKGDELTANPCGTKADGTYPIPDVFKFLTCKNHKASYGSCPKSEIYVPGAKKCINIGKVSYDNFCVARMDGDWANPFSCLGYILCEKGVAKARPCLINGFVFNPYLDVCVRPGDYPCDQTSNGGYDSALKMAPDPCKDKADGQYVVPDMFSYLACKNHEGKIYECKENFVYDDSQKKCVDGSPLSLKTFCKGKNDGNYQNLWDCHSFVSCVNEMYYVQPCPESLVYDPYFKRCETLLSFRCRELDTGHHVDKECENKDDGLYPTKDFFQYLECTSNQGTHHKCPPNHVFDPEERKRVDGKGLSKDTFCDNRKDGNYQNPWDCHSYISCVATQFIERPCAVESLVYNPYKDACEYSGEYECNQITGEVLSLPTTVSVEIRDICTTLPDDYYATRNVLQILQCKNHTSINIDCPDGQIYVPGDGPNCTDAAKISQENFCMDRSDGNWQDPFNCHSWYTCHAGITYIRPCSQFTILNYDPVYDLCEYPSVYPCKNVTTKRHYHRSEIDTKIKQLKILPAKKVNSEPVGKHIGNEEEKEDATTPSNNDPCADLPDGKYAVPDVGVIMICCHHVHTYQKCPPGQIYVPGQEECSPLKDTTEEAFCKSRKDGNWRNPWNCHDYITCHAGYSFDRPCSIKTILNYNPYKDLCEYPRDYPCENITSVTGKDKENRIEIKVTDKIKFIPSGKEDKAKVRMTDKIKFIPSGEEPCATLVDGKYAVADVGVILTCHNHVHTYEKCPPGQIYVPGKDKCTPLKHVIKAAFCKGRKDGNWRNPWNCHRYITCFAGYSFDRPCSTKTTLNYNPYDNLCEYPYDYKCENITAIFDQSKGKKEKTIAKATGEIETLPSGEEPCATLSDGIYAVGDVGVALVCHNHVHRYKQCAKGQIYVPNQEECSPLKDIHIEAFCKGRKDGNWRNPWNCHDYITCHAGYSFDRSCSIKTTLNYNPYENLCEYPYDYKCENITTTAEPQVFGTFDIVV